MIKLGCFVTRDKRPKFKSNGQYAHIPRLVLSGDLDGLIRVSRIAEDFYNHVLLEGNSEHARLHHAVVLVKGMVRHFFRFTSLQQ